MLELSGVHAYYGRSHVLHGVSLTVPAGEVVSLLGRNGAGKSTTLKAIVSLVRVERGAVRLDGRDITRLPTPQVSRLGIGFVPE
ncbi:MAG: ABC transporter ATP-binding protein, partial [Candidatus Rokuibacteriota bacterium]